MHCMCSCDSVQCPLFFLLPCLLDSTSAPRVMSPTSQQRRQHLQQQQQSFIEEEEWILQEEESHEQGSGAASLVMRPAGLEGNTSEQAMQVRGFLLLVCLCVCLS